MADKSGKDALVNAWLRFQRVLLKMRSCCVHFKICIAFQAADLIAEIRIRFMPVFLKMHSCFVHFKICIGYQYADFICEIRRGFHALD